MAFAVSERIWGRELVPQVQRDLARIATTIARFEPVSMLVRAADVPLARELTSGNVDLVTAELDDLWVRDTGPVFVTGAAVDFNFNGWGDKQTHGRDAKVARFVADRAGVEAVRTELVLEGGALEVHGEGTAIITESCVLNSNRNPGWTKHDVEEDLEILRQATDVRGRKLRVEVLEGPSRTRVRDEDFAAGYVNFYVCNGAVIGPEFGDREADGKALSVLTRLFPGRAVVQIDIDGIASGGGGIHCATQQEPR